MGENIGMWLIWVTIIIGIVFSVGYDMELKEKIKLSLGLILFVSFLLVGTCLLIGS